MKLKALFFSALMAVSGVSLAGHCNDDHEKPKEEAMKTLPSMHIVI